MEISYISIKELTARLINNSPKENLFPQKEISSQEVTIFQSVSPLCLTNSIDYKETFIYNA